MKYDNLSCVKQYCLSDYIFIIYLFFWLTQIHNRCIITQTFIHAIIVEESDYCWENNPLRDSALNLTESLLDSSPETASDRD